MNPSPTNDGAVTLADLIREHHRTLFGYAFRLTGERADAEDLVQQTFLIAHQKLHQLREPEKARGWLFAVLRSCFSKICRKQAPVTLGAVDREVDEIPAETDPDTIDQELLQLALNSLPPDYRIVVAMFYFEELSYKQIAAELELPIGTVMSRLSRGKARLRGVLLEQDPELAERYESSANEVDSTLVEGASSAEHGSRKEQRAGTGRSS